MTLTGYGNIIFLTSRAQNHYFSILTGYRNIIFLTSSTQNNYFSSLTGYENIICASSTCSKIIILSKQKIILGMKNIILDNKNIILLLYEGWNNYFKAPFGCQATGFMHELGLLPTIWFIKSQRSLILMAITVGYHAAFCQI